MRHAYSLRHIEHSTFLNGDGNETMLIRKVLESEQGKGGTS